MVEPIPSPQEVALPQKVGVIVFQRPDVRRLHVRLYKLGATSIRFSYDDESGSLEIQYVYEGHSYLFTCPYEFVPYMLRKGDDIA
ncbi:hypothetical protein [Microvirus mar29]|uniref:Uncharacterized protein n=1 Tax=Microvirus mar29 TaxID=2851162 RepID=A0A8F5RC10_9VIRU|nr:hypothetical protein [Microvirus mar29]